MTLIEVTELLGNLGNFFGSLAVLATLGYLAVQTRQANRTAAQAAVQANRAERRAYFLASRDSPYMPAISAKLDAGEPLTTEETHRYSQHLACTFAMLYSEWVIRDIGLAGEYAVSNSVWLAAIASSSRMQDWWRANGRGVYPARFCDHIDRAIAEKRATLAEQSTA